MPLHRYTTPSYFGGLPGTHDLINVVSGGLGAGDGSAIADGQKAGPHPNAGTYFVAFGEDGTSSNANRGLRALAENTDFLDDIVHNDQSIPTVSVATVPGAPVGSVVIAGNVFVGAGGETNDQRTRSGLVAVLDGDGIPLHVLDGTVYVPVLVSKIHDGLGSSVLGTGYYASPTVDFTPSIPTSQAYRLVYYARGNLKTQPTKTYTRLANGLRGAEDLWAYAKTTRLGTTVFTGDKDFEDEVTFKDLVTVTDDARFLFDDPTIDLDVPRLKLSDTTPAGSLLWFESGTASLGKHIRTYIDSADTPFATSSLGGQWHTTNAKQDPVTGDWIPDSVGAGLASITEFGAGTIATALMVGIPASWSDAEWRTPASPAHASMYTVINGFTITHGLVPTTDLDAFFTGIGGTLPFVFQQMDLGQLGARSYMMAELYQEASAAVPLPARVYASAGNGGTSPKLVSVATNAVYDFLAEEWSADTPAASGRDAYQVGLSGLNGLMARKRTDTTGTWTDSDWVEIMRLGTSSLALNSGYVFGWLTAKTVTHVISIARGISSHDSAGASNWRFLGDEWLSRVDQGGAAGDDELEFPLSIPEGAANLVVDVLVQPGAARASSSDRMRVRLMSRDVDWVSPLPVAFTASGAADARDDGTNVNQIVTVSKATLSASVEEELVLRIEPGNDADVNFDHVKAIRVTYDTIRLTNSLKS